MDDFFEKFFGNEYKKFRGPIVVTAVSVMIYFLNIAVAEYVLFKEPTTVWPNFILWFAYIYSQAFQAVYRPNKTHKWSVTLSWCFWIIAPSVAYMLFAYTFFANTLNA